MEFRNTLNTFTYRQIGRFICVPCTPIKKYIMQKEGTVKFFDTTKGFGFISQSDNRSDVFVHSTGLIDEIRENDKVMYDVEEGRKGLNAVNVKVI
jgi:CspA family cold shock protein